MMMMMMMMKNQNKIQLLEISIFMVRGGKLSDTEVLYTDRIPKVSLFWFPDFLSSRVESLCYSKLKSSTLAKNLMNLRPDIPTT